MVMYWERSVRKIAGMDMDMETCGDYDIVMRCRQLIIAKKELLLVVSNLGRNHYGRKNG